MPKINKGNKEKLIKRLTKQEEPPVEEVAQEEEDFSFLAPVEPIEEAPEEKFLTEEVVNMLFQEGYEAYLRGDEISSCPVERFNEEDQQVVQGVWEEGWATGLREFNTARIILDVKALVGLLREEELDEEAEEMYDAIFEDLGLAIDALDTIVNYAEMEEFCQNLMS